MSKKRNTTIVINHLIDKVEINSAAKMPSGALKHLRTVLAQEITDKMVEACIKALGDFTLRQDDTRNQPKCPFAKQGSASSISATQQFASSVPSGNTETESEELKLLRQTIRVVKHLVQVQDRSMPIRRRKYDPKLLDSLLWQTEILLNTLDRFVLPRLTKIDNNRC